MAKWNAPIQSCPMISVIVQVAAVAVSCHFLR
jgi:hypothetical protein